MSTVRDHRPRHVIIMFYPIETTLDLGPTSVLPTTQYSSVDRAGFHNSEERLSPFLRPPVGEDAKVPAGKAGYWQRASSAEIEFTQAQSLEKQDAARINNAVELLGDKTLEEYKVCVPAGSVVICHIDLFHRASRKTVEADWRPMFAVRSVARVSDPSGPTARLWRQKHLTDDDPFAHVIGAPPEHKAVWQEMFDYMCGHPHAPQTYNASDETVIRLERKVLHSNGEMIRLGAAYELGRLVAACGYGGHTFDDYETDQIQALHTATVALRALQRLLVDPSEGTRRAAAYGLTAAGSAALPWLNSTLRSPVALNSVPSDPQPNVDTKQGIIVQIVHAVAHCATRGAQPIKSAELVADTVSAVCEAVHRAAAEIEFLTAAATPDELMEQEPWVHNMYQSEVPLNFRVIERRRTIAEGAVALGLIGARAVADGRATIAAECCAALIKVANKPEPGLAWAAFMTRGSVVHNAALGLIRLTTDPLGSSGASLPFVHTGGGWADEDRRDLHNRSILQGMVQEARRRGAQKLRRAGLLPSSTALEGVLRQIEAAPWVWKRKEVEMTGGQDADEDQEAAPTDWTSYLVLQ